VFTGPDLTPRHEAWAAKITEKGLQDKYPSLLRPNRNETAAGGAGAAAAAAVAYLTDEEKKANLLTYFNCLAHQDELFRTAMEIIREKVIAELKGRNPGEEGSITAIDEETIIKYADEINAMKDTLFPYIQDVQYFVSFRTGVTVGGNNKFDELVKPETSLSTILLFPARVENIFIRALSEFIYTIINNPEVLNSANKIRSEDNILAVQYDSYTQALAYTLTSYSLRDGYHLDQVISKVGSGIEDTILLPRLGKKVDKENKFWPKFIKEIETSKTKDINTIFSPKNMRDKDITILAADMLQYAKLNEKNIGELNILAHLTSGMSINPDYTVPATRPTIPEPGYDDVTVANTDVNYKTIISNIKPEHLEFLLHLEVAIKECFARRKAEAAPPTPAE
jgi:hypothetical protein